MLSSCQARFNQIRGCPWTSRRDPAYPAVGLLSRTRSEGYYRAESYHGNPGDPAVIARDPAAVLVPSGLRMYFGLYDGNVLIPESGIYGMSTTIH